MHAKPFFFKIIDGKRHVIHTLLYKKNKVDDSSSPSLESNNWSRKKIEQMYFML